jgi:hypothetical protein
VIQREGRRGVDQEAFKKTAEAYDRQVDPDVRMKHMKAAIGFLAACDKEPTYARIALERAIEHASIVKHSGGSQ